MILQVVMLSAGKPWTEDPNHPHYEAAKRAVKHVFNVEPDMTREGGSIPVTLTLQEATGKNVILVPVGACDDGAHSQNEKVDVYNYIEGVSSRIDSSWSQLNIPFCLADQVAGRLHPRGGSVVKRIHYSHITMEHHKRALIYKQINTTYYIHFNGMHSIPSYPVWNYI